MTNLTLDEKIATLKSVAALDERIAVLSKEIEREKEGRLEKDREARALSDRRGALDASILEMERTRSSLQQELRQLVGQLEKAREKMLRCRNERESNAVSREVDELRRIQRERDIEIQKLAEFVEQAKAERDGLEGGETPAAESSSGATLEAERDGLLAERKALVQGFDGLLLRRYDAVRAKRGSGIAEVRKATCMACHIQLSPMLYQQMLHRKELLTCPSCLRILFLAPAPTSEVGSGDAEG